MHCRWSLGTGAKNAREGCPAVQIFCTSGVSQSLPSQRPGVCEEGGFGCAEERRWLEVGEKRKKVHVALQDTIVL